MSTKELYILRLKKMQATAEKISPASKSVTKKISLSVSSNKKPKKETNCLF